MTRRRPDPLTTLATDPNNENAGPATTAPASPELPSLDDEFVTPTAQEIAEVVFAGRRIGKRRRSELLRDMEIGSDSEAAGYNFHEAPSELVGTHGVRRSFHALLGVAALALFSGVLYRQDRGGYALELWVTLPDLALAACAVLYGPAAFSRVRKFRATTLTTGGVFLIVALAMSFAVHPSARGVFVLLRLIGAVGVADRLQQANRAEIRRVVQVLFGTAGFSVAYSLVQHARGSALGLFALGERSDPFFHFGDHLVPSAFLGHPYPLGGAALIASSLAAVLVLTGRLHAPWLYAAGMLAGFASVFSASRTNVLGLFLFAATVVVHLARKARMRALLFIVVVAIASSVGYVANPDVWSTKTGAYEVDGDVSAGRVGLFKENVVMTTRHLPLGVGPGRYNIELKNDGIKQNTGFPHPPQVVAMAALAEGGIGAGFALVVIGASFLGIARRRRFVAFVPVAALVAPLFSDHYMWSGAEGMVLVAIGFGVASRLSREPHVRELLPTAG